MGIRFACNLCEHSLNIKRELAGKVGVCPHCGGRIRIPLEDVQQSQAVANEANANGSTTQSQSKPSTSQVGAPVRTGKSSATASSLESSATLDTLEPHGRSLQSPLDEQGAQWYVRPPAGGQYGPATGEVLRTWIAENRVTGSTLIWRDGWPQWRSARETLPELAESTPRRPLASSGVEVNDLFDDPLMAPSQVNNKVAPQPLPGALTGNAAIGQQRSARSQRRMSLVIALAVLSIFLIITLVFLATRS